jgi:hypothetical protein
MSRRYNYTDGPLMQANEELSDLWRQVDAIKARKSQTITTTVRTTETEVRHDLGRVPQSVVPLAFGAAAVFFQTRAANENSVFLSASVEVKASITVE